VLLNEAQPLPYCAYPGYADVADHGIQSLPSILPLIDFAPAQPHRSNRYVAVPAIDLAPAQVLDMARVVGASFACREPQARHLRPPTDPPAGLMQARHIDPFGVEFFGPWTKETLLYWFIRLLLLTDPTAPQSEIPVNDEVLAQSIALLDQDGYVVGGAFNETMSLLDITPDLRATDPFLASVMTFTGPILEMLGAQDVEALTELITRYPDFRDAYESGNVGHHSMIARSDHLPKADTFELVAVTVERYRALGYRYMVVEASNQWTGAACEVLSGVRVHFAPFRSQPAVRESHESLEGIVTSADGYLSNKDSGCMFYVIHLN
jgi:hypothetical protein